MQINVRRAEPDKRNTYIAFTVCTERKIFLGGLKLNNDSSARQVRFNIVGYLNFKVGSALGLDNPHVSLLDGDADSSLSTSACTSLCVILSYSFSVNNFTQPVGNLAVSIPQFLRLACLRSSDAVCFSVCRRCLSETWLVVRSYGWAVQIVSAFGSVACF